MSAFELLKDHMTDLDRAQESGQTIEEVEREKIGIFTSNGTFEFVEDRYALLQAVNDRMSFTSDRQRTGEPITVHQLAAEMHNVLVSML